MTRSDPELIVELISTALGHQNREKRYSYMNLTLMIQTLTYM